MSEPLPSGPDGPAEQIELAAAYSELQDALLDRSDVIDFLQEAVVLAAAAVPATACSVTLRRDRQVTTAASSHSLARSVDEIQYGRGEGPCLEVLHTGERVIVAELRTDERWPKYRPHALQQGVESSLSLPLLVEGSVLGALNVYGGTPRHFDEAAVARGEAFAGHLATALRIVMHQAQLTALELQLREALAARALIDQAIGMIAAQQRVSASAAFALLREASQRRNERMTTVAGEVIERISGHPFEPPRPFTER